MTRQRRTKHREQIHAEQRQAGGVLNHGPLCREYSGQQVSEARGHLSVWGANAHEGF